VFDGTVTLPRPHRDDVLIAAAGLLGGIVLWSLGLHSQKSQDLLPAWAALVPLLVICVQSLFRRTHPMTGLAVGTAALVADQFTVGNLVTVVLFTDTVYSAVVYGPASAVRRVPVGAGLVTLVSTLTLLAVIRNPEGLLLGIIVGLVTCGPAATGVIIRNHREAAVAARLRAEQTALLAEMDRTQAVVAERARMARELHDLVANHLSAIAIHSTAALSLDDADTTRTALGVIRQNSVAGLAEMRRLIGLLRQGGDDAEPAALPTLSGLSALIGQARVNGAASGLVFTLDDRIGAGVRTVRDPLTGSGTDGSPGGGQPSPASEGELSIPAPVELAAYRIVQESLTNALKHAAPGTVRVMLGHEPGETVTVTVTSPFGSRPGPRAPGSGAGLVGMRERVALLGGEFAAGPEEGPRGGPEKLWRVRASLPVRDDREPNA
jgi:signal transduction histidine kinase